MMKKIILISVTLILVLTTTAEECKQWYYSGLGCESTDWEQQPCYNGCAFDGDVLTTNSCLVGKEQQPTPACVTESNICVEGSCPKTSDIWNGMDCSASIDSSSDTGANCVRTGKWDASEDKCMTCDANHQQQYVIAYGNTFYCNNVGAGIRCESGCGAHIECDEINVGGSCNGKSGLGTCQADCTCSTGGTLQSEVIPTLPDTEFCKDVDYCKDVTVVNDGTENADVMGCTYCQDITIGNKYSCSGTASGIFKAVCDNIGDNDCTKISGTFSDYATSEIPACPENVESVDVECTGLPEDISKKISTEYGKLTRGSEPVYPAYLSFLIQDVSAQPVCTITSVSWDREDAWDGEKANINVQTTDCADGTPMNLEIYQNDPIDDDPAPGTNWPVSIIINGNSARYTWLATWMDDDDFDMYGWPEYYVRVVGPTNTVDSEEMTVHTCMKVDWDRNQAYNEETVNMVVKITDKCLNRNVIFDIQEEDTGPNDDIDMNYGERTLAKEIKVPWKATWGIGDPDGINPPEYIFYAKIESMGANYIENSSLLTVSKCIKTAEWSEETTSVGEVVSLSVETGGDECKNKNIEIKIYEDDTLVDDEIPPTIIGRIDNNGKYTTQWTAIVQEDSWGEGKTNEFYFTATVKDNGNVIDEKESDILKVYRCIQRAYWSAQSAFEGDKVDLIVETNDGCNGFDVEFGIWEDIPWYYGLIDLKIADSTTNPPLPSAPQITNGKSRITWTVDRSKSFDIYDNDVLEYYFIVKIKDLSGNPFDEAESENLMINPCIKDGLILCEHMEKTATETITGVFTGLLGWGKTEGSVPEYIMVDANKYFRLARMEGLKEKTKIKFPEGEMDVEIDKTRHWLLDRNKYIIANGKSCEMKNISKYTIVNNAQYLDYIRKNFGEPYISSVSHAIVSGDEIEIHVDIHNSDPITREFKAYVLRGSDGKVMDEEPDTYWENIGHGDTETITLGSDWTPTWDVCDLGSSYWIRLDEYTLGTVETSNIFPVILPAVCGLPAAPSPYITAVSHTVIPDMTGEDEIEITVNVHNIEADDREFRAFVIRGSDGKVMAREPDWTWMDIDHGDTGTITINSGSDLDNPLETGWSVCDLGTTYWIRLDKCTGGTLSCTSSVTVETSALQTVTLPPECNVYQPPEYDKFYKKFVQMYGRPYADYLYCYKTVLKDTQWCQDMSREWYGLENNSVDVVDEKYIGDINKWNYYQDVDEMPNKNIFRDLQYKNSVIFEDAWTKVWTVTPLLNDTRNYLEWTKTGESNAYAGWGFDRKSICGTSCDAGTGTNAASGCTEKSSDCDTCEGGECGDCTQGNSGSCPGGPGPDCYDTCRVDERSGYIIDAEVVNANFEYLFWTGDCGSTDDGSYYCPSGYSCVDNSAHKCAKCPSSDYELLSLTMYDRQSYDSDDPATYSKVYKCIMDGVIKGETKFSIKDANVPDSVQPVKTRIKDNIWKITHPAFSITETGNLKYEIKDISLTKTGDLYTLTEFYKPDSSSNKLRFEIDADTNFSYTILPDAGKLQIEINHTYTTSYIKDNYYASCSENVCASTCSCDCGEDGSGCTGGYEYNYASGSCGGTSSWTTQSCSCDGGSTTTYRYERTTEILDDKVEVSEHWGFPWIWNFTTGGPVGTSPEVKYDKVFVSSNNKLYALDEFSGKKIWESSISTSESSPTAADDMVFVGSGNGILYAIDEKTGTQQWSWTVPGNIQINTKPAVDKGRVFFGSDDGRIYALDEYTGKQLWNYTTNGVVKSSPTVADGMVFFGSDDGKIYAVDEFSGEKKWEFLTMPMVDSFGTVWKDVRSSPTVSDGVVFVGSDGFYVYALNSSNGNYIWLSQAFAPVRTKPAVHDYRVFVGTMGLCSLPTWCSSIFAIDRYNGNLLWGYLTSKEILSSPAVAYNRIFFGSNNYNFSALDEDNGNLIWNYEVGGAIESSPTVDKGMIFFGANDKKVYALSAGIFPAHVNPADDARIKIEGTIDRYQTNTGFYGETVIGEINITLDPDILDSFVLSAECAFLMYTSQIYPAEHKLIAKESSAGTLGKNYNYNESYGYELTEFNYLEQCRKTCPLACNCYKEDGSFDRLLPNCLGFSEEGESTNNLRTDCVCLPDWCYPEQCTSTRTFHEDEGSTIANGDFENGLYSWNIVSGTAKTEFGGISGYKLKLRGNITQEIPSLSTNPADQICLNYWINDNNPGSFKLTAMVDGTPKEFTVYNGAPSCGIPAGWDKFCTPPDAIKGKLSEVGLKSDIGVFVDNVNLGKYYDFVDLKTFSLEDVEIMDEKLSPKDSFGGISFDDVTHENNTYTLKFSTTQLPYTVFNDANITLITNFRNITVKLFPASADIRENPYVNVKLKKPTRIFVQKVDPGKYNLKPGTQVTIYLKAIDLETNEPLVNEKVIAMDEKTGEEEVLITDSNGETTFTTTVGDFMKTITFIKVASAKTSSAETKESLNPYKTRSPLLSVEFLVLIIIFLLAVFAYRWFRKGRMDFYEMWEEIRGRK